VHIVAGDAASGYAEQCAATYRMLTVLRMALVLHEARALMRKTEKGIIAPEQIDTCAEDGHFVLAPQGSVLGWDAAVYGDKPKPDTRYTPVMPDHSQGKGAPV